MYEELDAILATLGTDATAPDEQAILNVLGLAARRESAEMWQSAFDAISSLPPPQRLELVLVIAAHAPLSPEQREIARALARNHPVWSVRAGEL